MSTYRCYLLDRAGKCSLIISIEAEDDSLAFSIAIAEIATSEAYPVIEIWQGNRLVGRVPQRQDKD
jgi:hypothetical protein